MKQRKLPFNIQLERKYNEINTENFLIDWVELKEERKERIVNMNNDLHIELIKFSTYEVSLDEIIDIGLRYALSKREFRNMITQLIKYKEENNPKI